MNTPILNVRGIGPATAALLAENGITSAEELAAQKVGSLAAVKGFSETRSRRVIADAQTLFAAVSTKTEPNKESTPAKETSKKKKKKDTKPAEKKSAKKPNKKGDKKAVKKDKKKTDKKKGKKSKKKKK
eukprot:Anaeramoba_flamelloidesa579325_12.p1 GENE.a579325_12~~a579325_12.p1  ORF type:complete len:129 (-),score=32.76 a579325_12:371-757(-)